MVAYLDVSIGPGRPSSSPPITFVLIPEYVARSWWERVLYNQAAKRFAPLFSARPHVVINVPSGATKPEPGRAAEIEPAGTLVAADNGTRAVRRGLRGERAEHKANGQGPTHQRIVSSATFGPVRSGGPVVSFPSYAVDPRF